MLKVDYGMMKGACNRNACYTTRSVGYINRNTGQIEFLHQDEASIRGYAVDLVDQVFLRSQVEDSPDWIEIPFYDDYRDDDDGSGFESHASAFFQKHGIEAELV